MRGKIQVPDSETGKACYINTEYELPQEIRA